MADELEDAFDPPYDPTNTQTPTAEFVEPEESPFEDLTDDGELANQSLSSMEDLSSAAFEQEELLEEPTPPEIELSEAPPESNMVPVADLDDLIGDNAELPLAPPQEGSSSPRLANAARQQMNHFRVNVFDEPNAAVPPPAAKKVGPSGLNNADFEAITFPWQGNSEQNGEERWGEFHEGSNSFRAAVVDHLSEETNMMIQHTVMIRLLTERLMRAHF